MKNLASRDSAVYKFLEHTKFNLFIAKGVDMDVDVVHFAVQLRTE